MSRVLVRISIAVAACLVIAACSANDPGVSTTVSTATSPTTTAGPTGPTTTTSSGPSTTSTTAPAADWIPPEVCEGSCDPAVEVLFSVPVGDEGIGYAYVDMEDAQATGPSAIAVSANDVVWIVDAVNRRLLAFTLDGDLLQEIDLAAYEVASAIDLASGPTGLLLLDIYIDVQRYRLLELDHDGSRRTVHDLPAGVRLEDGLSGAALGPGGELWLELQGGARVAMVDGSTDPVSFSLTNGYPYPDGLFGPAVDNPFVYSAGDVEISVERSGLMGGLRLLGVNPDGGFVLVLDEVSMDAGGRIQVDESVHLFDADGYHLGESVVPLTEQFLEVYHPLTLGPDGHTYMLLTGPEQVQVVRLPYFR